MRNVKAKPPLEVVELHEMTETGIEVPKFIETNPGVFMSRENVIPKEKEATELWAGRFPRYIISWLEDQAKVEDRSVAYIVRRILEDAFAHGPHLQK